MSSGLAQRWSRVRSRSTSRVLRRACLGAGLVAACATLAPSPTSAHPTGPKPVALIRPVGTDLRIIWIASSDDFLILRLSLRVPTEAQPADLPGIKVFREYFADRVHVANVDSLCPQSIDRVAPAGPGTAVEMRFRCGKPLGEVAVQLTLLQNFNQKYVTLSEARTPDGTRRGVFSVKTPVLTFDLEGSTPAVLAETLPEQGRSARIVAMLQGQAGSVSLAFAVALAFVLGAIHGLTPGHGKTITAAYLVGAGGNYRQALTLGGIVCLTHAAAVVILGLVAVQFDRLFLPSDAGPWLEIFAGALIVAMGLALLRPRREHRHRGFGHDHGRGAAGHRHGHHGSAPTDGTTKLPVRRLAALGLVGGLIPSPEAIGIVLVAFSVRQWGTGMLIIAAFSLGLAAVVLGVALVAVRGAAMLRRFSGGRLATVAPKIAAGVFVAMGVAVTIQGAIRA